MPKERLCFCWESHWSEYEVPISTFHVVWNTVFTLQARAYGSSEDLKVEHSQSPSTHASFGGAWDEHVVMEKPRESKYYYCTMNLLPFKLGIARFLIASLAAPILLHKKLVIGSRQEILPHTITLAIPHERKIKWIRPSPRYQKLTFASDAALR